MTRCGYLSGESSALRGRLACGIRRASSDSGRRNRDSASHQRPAAGIDDSELVRLVPVRLVFRRRDQNSRTIRRGGVKRHRTEGDPDGGTGTSPDLDLAAAIGTRDPCKNAQNAEGAINGSVSDRCSVRPPGPGGKLRSQRRIQEDDALSGGHPNRRHDAHAWKRASVRGRHENRHGERCHEAMVNKERDALLLAIKDPKVQPTPAADPDRTKFTWPRALSPYAPSR